MTTPGAKTVIRDADDDEEMEPQLATKYRALAARANFVASDRADIQLALTELANICPIPSSRLDKAEDGWARA